MRMSALMPAFAALLFVFSVSPSYSQTDPGTPQVLVPLTEEAFPGPPGAPFVQLNFGRDLAVRGNTALIAMPDYAFDHNLPGGLGRVAVFSRDSSRVWSRTGTLESSDRIVGDTFGLHVALADRVALVQSSSGVHVFRRIHGSWTQVQKITPQAGEAFGNGLALGDGVAFIQTFQNDQVTVRVYLADRHGRFVRSQRLSAANRSPADFFGSDLAYENHTLVVSAPGDRQGRGAAYVFTHFGPFWFPLQKLIAINGAPGDGFGARISIGDGLIAVGAPGSDPDLENADGVCQGIPDGTAYVFARRHLFWWQNQTVQRNGEQLPCISDFTATGIAVNRRWLVTGTYPHAFSSDSAFLFERVAGQFQPVAQLQGVMDGEPVVRVSGSTVMVGFPFERGFPVGQVSVYEFD